MLLFHQKYLLIYFFCLKHSYFSVLFFSTVDYKTLAEAKTRQLAIHAKYPMQKQNDDMTMEDMTDAEVEASMDEWHTAHNS